MNGGPRSFQTHNLGSLLNETFAIYSRHFKEFLALVAVVQVPVSFLTLVPADAIAVVTVLAVVTLFGIVCAYSATVYAVGQHYLRGSIKIGACYNRVYWRIATLGVITLILGMFMAAGVGLALLIFPTVIFVALLVYWSSAIPSVVVEGYKPISALRRSFNLVYGAWWRVFGITVVVFLVVIGFGVLLVAPFALVSRFVAFEESSAVATGLEFAGSVLVAVVVPPVAAIAGTLIYYDLRIRKENYDLDVLSQELGIAVA